MSETEIIKYEWRFFVCVCYRKAVTDASHLKNGCWTNIRISDELTFLSSLC